VITYTDVTDRDQAEKALRTSEERYAFAVSGTNDGLWDWNIETGDHYLSPRWKEILGYQDHELEHTISTFKNLLHPEDTEPVSEAVGRHFRERTTFAQDLRLRHKKGHYLWLNAKGQAIWDDHGKPQRMAGSIRDISERKQAEEKLHLAHELLEARVLERTTELNESKSRLEAVIRNTADGIVTIDSQGTILSFNPAAYEMFGFASDAVIGNNVSMLMRAEERAAHDEYLDKSDVQLPRIINKARELYGLKKDGTVFPIELNISPMQVDEQKMYVGIIRDITDRKRIENKLRENEEKFHTFYQVVPDVFTINHAGIGHYVEVNDAFCRNSGYTREQVIGKSPTDIGIWDDKADRDRLYALLGESGVVDNFEAKFRCKDGSIWPGMTSCYLIELDGQSHVLSATKNIADVKSSQQEAEKPNQAKSEFLSAMSHELRTPLNSILGFGQLLESSPEDPLNEDQKDNLTHILKNGRLLLDLINEVLDLSKIEAGMVEFSIEDVSTMEIIEDCLPSILGIAEDRGIDIFVTCATEHDLYVNADQMRLKQVLLNLFSNAVKYNRENGTISVQIDDAREGSVRITVTDTGHGIAHDKLGELFKPFSRLGAENSEIEGTGIGLVVCKDLIERMGGVVGVDSTVDTGSSFWFELPRAEGHDDDEGTVVENLAIRAADQAPDRNGTLLYVEDNPDNLKLMEKIVSRVDGLSMISAHNGELGIELARAKDPDVIILDINLPGMNGDELLGRLRQNGRFSETPILALSAAATQADIKKGLNAGFVQYLTKPIIVPDVVDAIKRALPAGR